jgi:hypothetical protein
MGGGGPAFVDPNQRTNLHEGKTTWYVIMTALVAASGGLMFGWVITAHCLVKGGDLQDCRHQLHRVVRQDSTSSLRGY